MEREERKELDDGRDGLHKHQIYCWKKGAYRCTEERKDLLCYKRWETSSTFSWKSWKTKLLSRFRRYIHTFVLPDIYHRGFQTFFVDLIANLNIICEDLISGSIQSQPSMRRNRQSVQYTRNFPSDVPIRFISLIDKSYLRHHLPFLLLLLRNHHSHHRGPFCS